MALSLRESEAITKIADLLYDFLPGNPHPFADQSISFAGAAADLGLANLWKGGSKHPAICHLLENTLDTRRDQFCRLILEIVRRGLKYRANKGNRITREEVQILNELIEEVQFKIPDLWDTTFLDSLPRAPVEAESTVDAEPVAQAELVRLEEQLLEMNEIEEHARGFAFEKFLKDLFAAFGLEPRSSFRLEGEQIDGSLQLDADTYLVEAKWQKKPVSAGDLREMRDKVESKSAWSRGLFVSYTGFSEPGLGAFSKGHPTNLIAMTGQDLFFILEGRMSLPDAIRQKARRAAETGEPFVSVQELSAGS